MKSIYVQFVSLAEEKESEEFGPYKFVQVTYETIRDPEGEEIAFLDCDGYWVEHGEPGQQWSDISIFTKEEE